MLCLGLDISTSCTGWCILSTDMTLVDGGFIHLSKYKGLYTKSQKINELLLSLKKEHQISNIFIEENLQAFRPGLSSAKTLMTLSRFNGMVSLLCYNIFDLTPTMMNVNVARKSLGIKLVRKKDGGIPTKEQIVNWVKIKLGSIGYKWPTKILKGGPRRGQIIFDPGCHDFADAYVIAAAGTQCQLNTSDE